jgi:hypothetical protein
VAIITGSFAYEVVARYFFAAPTSWAYDLSSYALCPMIFLAIPAMTQQRAHIAVAYLVEGLRFTANLTLEIAKGALQVWQNFRGAVVQVDNLINGMRTAYAVFRRNAVNMDPTRLRNPLTGEIISEGVSRHLPGPDTTRSNLAGGLRDMAGAMEDITRAQVRLLAGERRNRMFVMLERAYERGEYYETLSDALPVGSRPWFEQKEREGNRFPW